MWELQALFIMIIPQYLIAVLKLNWIKYVFVSETSKKAPNNIYCSDVRYAQMFK